MASPGTNKQFFKKSTSGIVLKRPKTRSKKKRQKKKKLPFGSNFFFAAFPIFFFSADLCNRFRLADLGGVVKPLRELF